MFDAWDVGTFDDEVALLLSQNSDIINKYYARNRAAFVEYDTAPQYIPMPSNHYASDFGDFVESLIPLMSVRTVRAWHYTRLVDEEVEIIRRDGIELSTATTLRKRLNALIEIGMFDEHLGRKLFTESPLHANGYDSRSNKFWLVSKPVSVCDAGVEYLVGYWGGEVVNMGQDDATMATLAKIGRGRVLECVVPLQLTEEAYSASRAVVAAYGRSVGCRTDTVSFDLYVKEPLLPSAILHIHSEGEASYRAIGKHSCRKTDSFDLE